MLQALADRAGPSTMDDDGQKKKSVFHIDTSLIVGAPSAEQVLYFCNLQVDM